MANPLKTVRDYVMHSIAELKKVTWPSREMTIRFSVLVIIISTAFAGFFAALDFGLRQTVDALFVTSDTPQAVPPPDVTPELQDSEGDPIDVNVEGADEPQEFQIQDVEAESTDGTSVEGALDLELE